MMNISGIQRTQSLSFGTKLSACSSEKLKLRKLYIDAIEDAQHGKENGIYYKDPCYVRVKDDCFGKDLHDAKRAADRDEIKDLVIVKPYKQIIK